MIRDYVPCEEEEDAGVVPEEVSGSFRLEKVAFGKSNFEDDVAEKEKKGFPVNVLDCVGVSVLVII